MNIVTSGAPYIDIDAYAGCIAYAELLQVQGIDAAAASTAPLNESISETVRSWGSPLKTEHVHQPADTYTLVDVSDPDYFDTFVEIDAVTGIIDHHTGFEKLWEEKLGDKAYIEYIGAACTLVYEQWKEAGKLEEMSTLSARLLICGILDNTLNFGAQVSTQRDVDAHEDLLTRADLPDDWTPQYFNECQATILDDIPGAINNDYKNVDFSTHAETISFGQMAVWDAKQVIEHNELAISLTMQEINQNWFMNVISVGEQRSYFVSDNPAVQMWLKKLLQVEFVGSIARADRLWLRKEVIKHDRESPSSN